MVNYFECKYLTLVGHVQSGKTNEEINYTYQSITNGFSVIFILRNITADQLQLATRIQEFNKTVDNPLNVKILSHNNYSAIAKSMSTNCVVILLCNRFQLRKMRDILTVYQGLYNVCIDEVDFSIKTRNMVSETDVILDQIKRGANHILGATATPVALFTSQPQIGKIIKLKPNTNYRGIDSLNIEFVDNFVTNDPRSDIATINKIYTTLSSKDHCVLLHSVTKKRKNHTNLMNFISQLFPSFTYIIYNGDGIIVLCKNRILQPFKNTRSVNKYGQNILKYHLLKEGIHRFENFSIAEVLQILVDDPYYRHTHISIISGHLASRGVSFVSTDYTLHLTDQYYVAGTTTHGENYLQSLRILGCYRDDIPLTLWCNQRCWKRIIQHNNIINNLINTVHNDSQWLTNIKKVVISRPDTPLTRPNLNARIRKLSNEHFALEISSDDES